MNVQSDTLLLADISKNFRNKWTQIYEIYPVHSLSASSLAWQSAFKKANVELQLLDNNSLILVIKESISNEILNVIHENAKANNKYMKHYDKHKGSLYLIYCYMNNLHEWTISKKLPVNAFEQIKN